MTQESVKFSLARRINKGPIQDQGQPAGEAKQETNEKGTGQDESLRSKWEQECAKRHLPLTSSFAQLLWKSMTQELPTVDHTTSARSPKKGIAGPL